MGGAFRVIGGDDEGLYFRHGDHLGSTSGLSDEDGLKVDGSEVVYAPFGEIREGDLSDLTDFGFTGQQLDRSTGGLMYYGARYYLPELRRFISADTIVPDPGNPQALNRFSYVYNNPVKLVDPTGHDPHYCDSSPDPAGCYARAEKISKPDKPKPPSLEEGATENGEGPGDSETLDEDEIKLPNFLHFERQVVRSLTREDIVPLVADVLIEPTVKNAIGGSEISPERAWSVGNYDQRVENMEMAVTIFYHPDSSLWEKALSGYYVGVEVSAHAGLALGLAGYGVGSLTDQPDPGGPAPTGQHGTASDFGSLDGMTQAEADTLLKGYGPRRVTTTKGGYTHYKYPDGSEVVIGPDLEVDRIPAPTYDASGRRQRGWRLGSDGNLYRPHDPNLPPEKLEP